RARSLPFFTYTTLFRSEQGPPAAFREPPAPAQAADRVRVFNHDRGGIEAHRDRDVQGDDAADDEADRRPADRQDRRRTGGAPQGDRKSTRLNSSHEWIS